MFTHNTWANSPRTDHSDDDPHHPTEGAGAHQAWIIKTLAMPNDNLITSPTRGHERPAKKVPSISFLLLSLRESPVLLPSQAKPRNDRKNLACPQGEIAMLNRLSLYHNDDLESVVSRNKTKFKG